MAYVSPDFREHPVAILLAPLLERHDRSRFEVIGIALNPPDETPVGQRVRAACDELHLVWEKSDAEVAQLIRDLEIDIAVDMAGFTTGNRSAVFASRPAPLQVSYLGFAGSMGASYIDYVVADPVIAPPEAQPHYAEQIVRLPDTYQVNDTHYAIAEHTPSRAELGLPEQGFVFCCFNNSFKLTADVFAIWMRLLSSVPDSVLWLAATRSEVVTNLGERARALGVEPSRLVFAPRVPERADHFARYRHADLFLDTLPFNAHATATDALWCGVPRVDRDGGVIVDPEAAFGAPAPLLHSAPPPAPPEAPPPEAEAQPAVVHLENSGSRGPRPSRVAQPPPGRRRRRLAAHGYLGAGVAPLERALAQARCGPDRDGGGCPSLPNGLHSSGA